MNLPGDESTNITNRQETHKPVAANRVLASSAEDREPFCWRIPRTDKSPRNLILAFLIFTGGIFLVCVVLPSLILWAVLHYMGLDPREHQTQFLQFGVAGALLTAGLASYAVIVYLQDLLGTGVTVRQQYIELSNRDRSRFEWARIRLPQVIAGDDRKAVDGRSERGQLEFRYETSPGVLQEHSLPIYGDVDLAALRKFAEEQCAKD